MLQLLRKLKKFANGIFDKCFVSIKIRNLYNSIIKREMTQWGGGELNRYFTKKYMEITNEIFLLL